MAPQKIILDTDPGVDDVLAILLALASPEVDVALISIVFGNTDAPVAHANLLKIYHLLAQEIAASVEAEKRYHRLSGEREKTVLAVGEDSPIGGEKVVAAYFHGRDGLSNISETHPHFTPPPRDGDDPHQHLEVSNTPSPQLILDILRREPEHTVTMVALGPLTNVAQCLREDPATLSRMHTLVWMGGALDHPGNTSPTSEFNCFADPYAAAEVVAACRAGLFPLVMAPLDITTPHQIPFDDLIHPDPAAVSPLRNFISSMLVRVRGLQASFGLPDAMEMHDPVAVWYALAHAQLRGRGAVASGWALEERDFKVERTGEYTRGMCVVDRRGTNEEGERTKNEGIADGRDTKVQGGKKVVDTGRMGEKLERTEWLPQVIKRTPGKEVLRQVLLGRVFGTEF